MEKLRVTSAPARLLTRGDAGGGPSVAPGEGVVRPVSPGLPGHKRAVPAAGNPYGGLGLLGLRGATVRGATGSPETCSARGVPGDLCCRLCTPIAGRGLPGEAGGTAEPPAGGLGVNGGLMRGARGGRGGRQGREPCEPDSSSDVEICLTGVITADDCLTVSSLAKDREFAPGREFDFSLFLCLPLFKGNEEELLSLRMLRSVESLDIVISRHKPNFQLLEMSQLLPSLERSSSDSGSSSLVILDSLIATSPWRVSRRRCMAACRARDL